VRFMGLADPTAIFPGYTVRSSNFPGLFGNDAPHHTDK
jgi:hypothetical protein